MSFLSWAPFLTTLSNILYGTGHTISIKAGKMNSKMLVSDTLKTYLYFKIQLSMSLPKVTDLVKRRKTLNIQCSHQKYIKKLANLLNK